VNTDNLKLNKLELTVSTSTLIKMCLLCYVVIGLDNIEIGLSDVMPTVGSAVDTSSYTVCQQHIASTTAGQKITINCDSSSQQFRYVIVRSSDATPEHLCIAEVAVYAGMSVSHHCILTILIC